MAALDANSVNAFELPVENVAVPWISFAEGAPSVSFSAALLALWSSKGAAPARICALPSRSVARRPPLNTGVRASAEEPPARACAAVTKVPGELAVFGRAHAGAT